MNNRPKWRKHLSQSINHWWWFLTLLHCLWMCEVCEEVLLFSESVYSRASFSSYVLMSKGEQRGKIDSGAVDWLLYTIRIVKQWCWTKAPAQSIFEYNNYFSPYILASPQLQQLWKLSFLLLASNEWTLISFLLCVCNTGGALLKRNTFHSEWSLQLDTLSITYFPISAQDSIIHLHASWTIHSSVRPYFLLYITFFLCIHSHTLVLKEKATVILAKSAL